LTAFTDLGALQLLPTQVHDSSNQGNTEQSDLSSG
jgi:hypothetical protein